MSMLSEDDVDLANLSAEELDAAWDLWFDLAQSTNDADPLYSHGVLVGISPPASSLQPLACSLQIGLEESGQGPDMGRV